MDIRGKKINFLGDSITEGAGVADKGNIYHARLAKQYDLTARNYGISATRISRQTDTSRDSIWNKDFIERVDRMDPNADIVVVFGGTNDFGPRRRASR